MIRRLANKLVRWANSYGETLDEPRLRYSPKQTATLVGTSAEIDFPNPMRFKVQAAAGGTIVEVAHYDRKRDENRVNLHIIPTDTDDLAVAIGHIVTLELLKA